MGIYLPPIITTPIFIGALISWFIRGRVKKSTLGSQDKEKYRRVDRKTALIASGLIVGESLVGVIMAVIIVISVSSGGSDAPLSLAPLLGGLFGDNLDIMQQLFGLLVFVAICVAFVRRALSALKK